MLALTIVTREGASRPGYFGKGRWGGIIDFGVNRALDYLEQTELYKYGKLPPQGSVV